MCHKLNLRTCCGDDTTVTTCTRAREHTGHTWVVPTQQQTNTPFSCQLHPRLCATASCSLCVQRVGRVRKVEGTGPFSQQLTRRTCEISQCTHGVDFCGTLQLRATRLLKNGEKRRHLTHTHISVLSTPCTRTSTHSTQTMHRQRTSKQAATYHALLHHSHTVIQRTRLVQQQACGHITRLCVGTHGQTNGPHPFLAHDTPLLAPLVFTLSL